MLSVSLKSTKYERLLVHQNPCACITSDTRCAKNIYGKTTTYLDAGLCTILSIANLYAVKPASSPAFPSLTRNIFVCESRPLLSPSAAAGLSPKPRYSLSSQPFEAPLSPTPTHQTGSYALRPTPSLPFLLSQNEAPIKTPLASPSSAQNSTGIIIQVVTSFRSQRHFHTCVLGVRPTSKIIRSFISSKVDHS